MTTLVIAAVFAVASIHGDPVAPTWAKVAGDIAVIVSLGSTCLYIRRAS